MMIIQGKLEGYKRKKALEKITYNMGRIEETEDVIYCYVDEKIFKSKCDYNRIYGFNLSHSPVIIYGTIYELKKDIVYIFDGIFFDKPLTFFISSKSHNCIKFQNCTFTQYVSIGKAENVEFINNRSNTHRMLLYTEKTAGVKNLKFVDDYTLFGFADSIRIKINCETLAMSNTEFHCDETTIKADNVIMNNSHIYSWEKIKIDSDTIELTDSNIHSSNEIILNVKQCNDFSGIKAFDITYNGLSLSKYNNSYEYIDNLIEERQKLLDTLSVIKVTEEEYQKHEVNNYRRVLKNSPISRRLNK